MSKRSAKRATGPATKTINGIERNISLKVSLKAADDHSCCILACSLESCADAMRCASMTILIKSR